MKKKIFTVVLGFLLLIMFASSAYCSSAAIKKGMIERLPVINALKVKGIVGENNKGFLQFITNKKEKENVINAENKARNSVYTAIAKKQNTTAAVVGKHRAVQISKKAKAGLWFQNASGKWYQKK